ncbi:MAG: hypothetical protein HN929_11965 [Chloroflexi bacterium]|nr:hypothetical protein [Chloroflexota bacterium]MBT7082155.1 hypothetical protein [Chloroflexota bacterium]MBT7290796.1 hypothetical protein [Chloroflexota bacterium]
MRRINSSQLVSVVMVAIIIGLGVWRLQNSTKTWWTIVVAVLLAIGVGTFIYSVTNNNKSSDD